MSEANLITLQFPGDLEYIPAVRKFVSETLKASGFGQNDAFRSEIIIDELCHNAITFGSQSDNTDVQMGLKVYKDRLEFVVKDRGGSEEDLQRLKEAAKGEPVSPYDQARKRGEKLGLDIVRMLSEKLDVSTDDGNVTTVRVVRKRGDLEKEEHSSNAPREE